MERGCRQNDSPAGGAARHFLPVGAIKRMLDGVSMAKVSRGLTAAVPVENPHCSRELTRVRVSAAKLNVFHWHLTDLESFPVLPRNAAPSRLAAMLPGRKNLIGLFRAGPVAALPGARRKGSVRPAACEGPRRAAAAPRMSRRRCTSALQC